MKKPGKCLKTFQVCGKATNTTSLTGLRGFFVSIYLKQISIIINKKYSALSRGLAVHFYVEFFTKMRMPNIWPL